MTTICRTFLFWLKRDIDNRCLTQRSAYINGLRNTHSVPYAVRTETWDSTEDLNPSPRTKQVQGIGYISHREMSREEAACGKEEQE